MTAVDLSGPQTGTGRQQRYIADLLALHDGISLRALTEQVDPLYLAHRPDGLTVLAVRQSELPERYRLALYGFRLAQYLRARFASERITFERGLFAEPRSDGHGEEIHLIGLSCATGAVLRYVSVVGLPDDPPRAVTDPDRTRFPCEVAHGVNLFAHVRAPGVRTDEVWEVKRLMQRGSEPATPLAHRLRVSLELMLAFYRVLGELTPAARFLVGDGEEAIAVQRLLRCLRDVTVLEGTVPSLPEEHLLHPAYVHREVVKPFVARLPQGEDRDRLIGWLEEAVARPEPLAGFRDLVRRTDGRVRRVPV